MKIVLKISIIILISVCVNFPQNVIFKSITTEEGLSSSDVNCLMQDKLGFIWIGTDNGLNRFDGSEFRVFRNNPSNTNSISDNSIWALFEDRNGNIWIGTKGGNLNRYSPVSEKIELIKIGDNKSASNSITAILEDSRGSIWVGTYSQGLFNYDPLSGKIKNWKFDPKIKNGLSNNYITSLLQDNRGFIWISTYNGLNRLNPEKISSGFEVFLTDNSDLKSLSNNLVWKVNQSEIINNLIWIGTANGLCTYDIEKRSFNRLTINAKLPSQFSNSFSSVVEQNESGKDILWASTYGGLYKIDLKNYYTEQFINDEKNSQSIIGNQIDQLLVDRSGVLWIATEKGLSYHSLKTQKFNKKFSQVSSSSSAQDLLKADIKGIVEFNNNEFYIAATEGLFSLQVRNQSFEVKKFDELNNLNLWSIEKGLNNDLWIGTYGNGLLHFDLASAKKNILKINSPTFQSEAVNYIKALHLDNDSILWIGFWGGGLAAFNTKTNNYDNWIAEINNDKSISHNDIWALHEDKLGRLWIGTNGGGLNLFIPKDGGSFLSWKFEQGKTNTLINNSIQSITEITSENISETILVIGTENGSSKAVIKNNPKSIYSVDVTFSNLSKEKVLLENSIKGILVDKNGSYWVSTNSGLIQHNSTNGTLINFNNADGLYSNIFNSGAYIKSNNGLMIFGTVKGPVIFNPAEINLSKYEPNIVFTDFQIFNRSIHPAENSNLKTSIVVSKEINLSYDQNVIGFKFAALDYNASNKIEYLYKLEGFDKDWIKSGPLHLASYTNLDPGSYIFKVKGTNSDGFWSSKTAIINLNIAPPIWKTAWAYAIYILLIGFGLFAIRKFELSRSRLRNELRIRDLETKKIREIENMKSRFFANLSHEFRTPLMLIKGPSEQLLNDINSSRIEQYKLIHRNSEKLQNLIDQLLELSQLESSSIPVRAKNENIIPVLRGLFYSFASYAEQNNIQMNFSSAHEKILVWFDRDKLDKIFNNLFSNAFKFTPNGGSISVDVKSIFIKDNEHLQINVKDSGIGIPKDKIEKIFDRFFQVDDSSRRAYGGSGIGLALVRELVDLHKWKIYVDSEIGKGTVFGLEIPLNDFYLNEEEKIQIKTTQKSEEEDSERDPMLKKFNDLQSEEVYQKTENHKSIKSIKQKSSVLIVEDSEDVRLYLSELLKDEYYITLSENGEKGLLKAFETLPDIIISDVMMPEMDGIEFCKRIKSDWQTSHIPVILLTAKASSESKIEGLETGADDYVTKPFSFRELSIRIKNLLEQRTLLKEKYSKDVKFIPENITLNKSDQEFFNKSVNIVEKYIGDSAFDSDKFANEIFLSRSQLHRKLQSITGQSTGEFIRTVRLKKAAGLILEKQFSITQISYEVGFNSPSHFTKAFKQLFDCLPSEFINRDNS